MLKTSRNTLLI